MPFKAVLDLPDVGELDKKTVNTFLKKSKKIGLPSLPKGKFERITNSFCYMFRHKQTVGCRTTNSCSHLSLPNIQTGPVSTLPLPPKERKGIGSMFFDCTLRDYTILEQGEIVEVLKLSGDLQLEVNVQNISQPYRANEQDRTLRMFEAFNIAGKEGLIKGALSDNNQYCPFKGGGDIYIGRKYTGGDSILSGYISSILVDDDDDDDHNNLSPKRPGDLRCGAIENKASAQQSEDSVCHQLKANMLLCSVNQLTEHAKNRKFDASKVERIKCYGLTVCFPPLPILLLELTVDFPKCTYEYKELCRCNDMQCCPLVVDCALEYIVQRVSE